MAGGPTLYPLTPALALSNLRIDLSDTNAAAYRWQDSDLNRAIDKALERYSRAYPFLQATQQQAQTQTTLYALPAGGYYTDSVEYPVGLWPKSFRNFRDRKSSLLAAPNFAAQPNNANPPAVSFAAGGALSAGTYTWAITYTCPGGGETPPSQNFTAIAGAGQEASITNIPVGPFGVTGRNIYRSTVGGGAGALKLAGSIADNITGSFLDPIADASLGVTIPAANSSAGLDITEIQLPPELWPADATKTIEIVYASKHLLTAGPPAGSTVPERHWNAFYLGSLAFAMWAYLPQVNDNFLYDDGHLRDRVDDTKSTTAWSSQCRQAMKDFDALLETIKEEANAYKSRRTQWGDVPWRWDRV